MAMEFIYSILGPWSRKVIPWFVEHPEALAGIYLVWMLFLWAGKMQLRRVESFLNGWIIDQARILKKQNKKPDSKVLYEQARQELRQQMHHLAWFVPHKSELFPIPALPKLVEKKLEFSPDWVQKALRQNSIGAN